MNPILCAHCGINFMRSSQHPENEKLCNSCLIKENLRNPSKDLVMDKIDILIQCPKDIQKKIEEHCMAKNISFSEYFLSLHEQAVRNAHQIEEVKPQNTRGKSK